MSANVPSLTRRAMASMLGASAIMPLTAGFVHAGKIDRLALYGPPAGPSVTLAHAVADGGFGEIAKAATFTVWRNPDELRAGLTSGAILLSVVPIQAAANLYNRGFPIRLANVMTDGLLYIISDTPEIRTVRDLAGRSLAVPFRGDTPELILGQLLEHHGLDAQSDLKIRYTGSPVEAMQLLLAGQVEAALTGEPSTTAGVLRGKRAGKDIRRAIDVQAAWGDMTGAVPVLPQAGLAVTKGFLDTHDDAVPRLLSVLETATADVLADPARAAANAREPLGLPAPLIAASVPHCNLVARPAAEARADIERMLTAMAGDDMRRIAGRLPDDDFYL
ncbi:MAG: ABC transporter substrate-binding protein [Pseudomonadota bacterium]